MSACSNCTFCSLWVWSFFLPNDYIYKLWPYTADRLKLLFLKNKFPTDEAFMSIEKIKTCALNYIEYELHKKVIAVIKTGSH